MTNTDRFKKYINNFIVCYLIRMISTAVTMQGTAALSVSVKGEISQENVIHRSV